MVFLCSIWKFTFFVMFGFWWFWNRKISFYDATNILRPKNCQFTCFTIYDYRKKVELSIKFCSSNEHVSTAISFYVEMSEKIDNANRCRMRDDLKRFDWNEHMLQHERTLCTRMDGRRIDSLASHKQCVCTQQLRWAMNSTTTTIKLRDKNTAEIHNVLFVRLTRSLWWLQYSGNHIYFTNPHQKQSTRTARIDAVRFERFS